MADDKDEHIPDPWAGLEAAGGDDADGESQDESAFSFEGLAEDSGVAFVARAGDDAGADDGSDAGDDPEAVIEAAFVEAEEAGGFESLEAEAVVEDDIAGWLSEPAAAAQAADADEETEFVGTIFAGPVADEELEEVEAVAEVEEAAETLFMSDEADADADAEPAAVLAIGGAAVAAATAATKPPKAKTKKKSGGVLGPIIGGLLSLPIVFLILLGLLWGTGRDPIGMRSWLPSFMLPARQGGQAVAAAADTVRPSLDDLAAAAPNERAGETADGEPDAAEKVDPEPSLPVPEIAIDSVVMANETATPVIEPPIVEPVEAASPEPPALDFSGIEAAVEAALASMESVSADQSGDPADRRRGLVAWYKDLARVGAELAMLETAAADSGHPLTETPGPVTTLYGRLEAAGTLGPDLKRLCRNWVDYAKRPADGVLLVGVLDGARQVGPFWYATLSLEQVDGSLRPVSLISRRPPRADPGDRVAVAGVVFSEDMVWAADCGRLDTTVAGVEDAPF